MESSDVAEIKHHFNVVAEGLEKKIQLVAVDVSALDERMTSLQEKMERGFDEVKAMIKFSRMPSWIGALRRSKLGSPNWKSGS